MHQLAPGQHAFECRFECVYADGRTQTAKFRLEEMRFLRGAQQWSARLEGEPPHFLCRRRDLLAPPHSGEKRSQTISYSDWEGTRTVWRLPSYVQAMTSLPPQRGSNVRQHPLGAAMPLPQIGGLQDRRRSRDLHSAGLKNSASAAAGVSAVSFSSTPSTATSRAPSAANSSRAPVMAR